MAGDQRFVGRKDELDSFVKMLDDPAGVQRLKFIWGPGGIGKTWLMRAMLQKAKERADYLVAEPIIDMYSTGHRHTEGVIEAIISRLLPALPHQAFTAYEEEKAQLGAARQQEGYAPTGIESRLNMLATTFRRELEQVLRTHPLVLAFDTFEHIQDAPVGRWILSDQGLQMPGLLCIVASRKPNPADREQPPLGGLSDAEAVEFCNQYMPVLGSLTKRTEEDVDYVIRLNGRTGGNPLLLGLALFWLDDQGLSKDKWEALSQAEFEKRIASWLSPARGPRPGALFSNVPADVREPLRQTLVCMAYLNRRFNRVLFERLVQEGYVTAFDADAVWKTLIDQLPDFFYVKERPKGEIQLHDKLAEMLRLYVLTEAEHEWMGKNVRDFANDVVGWYEDLIRQATDDQQKADLQVEKLAYAMRMDILVDTGLPERKDVEEAQQLAYLLPPDFVRAKELLVAYRREHSDVLNRLVVNEMRTEIVAHFPTADRYEVCTILGDMAQDAYLLEESSRYWQCAFETAKETNNVQQQIIALRWQSNSTWQREAQEALNILQQALKLCEQVPELSPEILYSMGFVHRRIEDLDEAIEWYERAKSSAQLYDSKKLMTPTILNDMGYALLLRGDYDKAEAHIRMAAVLRERNREAARAQWAEIEARLEHESNPQARESLRQKATQAAEAWRDATRKLGFTYNTLGQLARQSPNDLADATSYYAEALAIFNELNDYYWQAQSLHARGDAHRRLALDLFYKERKDACQRYDGMAFSDIQASLDLCRRYGYFDLLPFAERRMGRLLHDRALRVPDEPEAQIKLIKQALSHFEAGITAARQSKNVQEELENSTEIAFLSDDLIRAYRQQRGNKALTPAQREEIKAYLEQFEQTIERHRRNERRIYQFPVFEDLLKIERGAFHYELGEYDQAFAYYLDGYTGLASDPGYGSARCRAHIGHLFTNIRKLADRQLKQEWYQRFISTWQSTPMKRNGGKTVAEAHPRLIEQFQLHELFE